jgi:hypothetical protein
MSAARRRAVPKRCVLPSGAPVTHAGGRVGPRGGWGKVQQVRGGGGGGNRQPCFKAACPGVTTAGAAPTPHAPRPAAQRAAPRSHRPAEAHGQPPIGSPRRFQARSPRLRRSWATERRRSVARPQRPATAPPHQHRTQVRCERERSPPTTRRLKPAPWPCLFTPTHIRRSRSGAVPSQPIPSTRFHALIPYMRQRWGCAVRARPLRVHGGGHGISGLVGGPRRNACSCASAGACARCGVHGVRARKRALACRCSRGERRRSRRAAPQHHAHHHSRNHTHNQRAGRHAAQHGHVDLRSGAAAAADGGAACIARTRTRDRGRGRRGACRHGRR